MNAESVNTDEMLGAYASMLKVFRTVDLITLLSIFNNDTTGSKYDLQIRAIDLLKTIPRKYCRAYLTKIIDIFKLLPYHGMDNNVPQFGAYYQDPFTMMSSMRSFHPVFTSDLQFQQHIVPVITQDAYDLSPPRIELQFRDQAPFGLNMFRSSRNESNAIPNVNSSTSDLNHLVCLYGRQVPTVNQQLNASTQSNTTNNNNDQGLPTNMRFKKIPFYEIIDEILKPTILTNQDPNLLQQTFFSRELMTNTFEFKLSHRQATYITMSTITSNGNTEYTCQLQMRIGELRTGSSEIIENIPDGFFIQTSSNMNTWGKSNYHRSDPIDCTSLFKLESKVSNEVCVNWSRNENTYVVGIYLVQKLSSNTLLSKLRDKNRKSSEETKNFIMTKMAEDELDPDLQTSTLFRFSLICPLGKDRIKTPVNSINCDHLQCFDASTFIRMNERTPTWRCPICDRSCFYDDLQVQSYFLDIIENPDLPNFVNEIELLSNGGWREFQLTRTVSYENISEASETPVLDDESSESFIDLTTVEDEAHDICQ